MCSSTCLGEGCWHRVVSTCQAGLCVLASRPTPSPLPICAERVQQHSLLCQLLSAPAARASAGCWSNLLSLQPVALTRQSLSLSHTHLSQANLTAVLFLPCATLWLYVAASELLVYLGVWSDGDDKISTAAASADSSSGGGGRLVAGLALLVTPIVWCCILRRDAANAVGQRARAADAAAAAAAVAGRSGGAGGRHSRPRASAPTRANTETRAASGASSLPFSCTRGVAISESRYYSSTVRTDQLNAYLDVGVRWNVCHLCAICVPIVCQL